MLENIRENLKINLIRAGKTKSGKENALLGWQDEELLTEEEERILALVENGIYPPVSRVYTSSLLRSRQTAYIIYRGIIAISLRGLEPYDYGEFEGITAIQLATGKETKDFLFCDTMDTPPEGEAPYLFNARVSSTFKKIIREIEKTEEEAIAIVCHRTVINSILKRYVIPRSVQRSIDTDYGGGMQIEYSYRSGMAKTIKEF